MIFTNVNASVLADPLFKLSIKDGYQLLPVDEIKKLADEKKINTAIILRTDGPKLPVPFIYQ